MAKQWRDMSEAEKWRRKKRRAEMIAEAQKLGTATADEIEWLKRWKRQQRWEQWQSVKAARARRVYRESGNLGTRMARDRDP
jgi:hypothetical protein